MYTIHVGVCASGQCSTLLFSSIHYLLTPHHPLFSEDFFLILLIFNVFFIFSHGQDVGGEVNCWRKAQLWAVALQCDHSIHYTHLSESRQNQSPLLRLGICLILAPLFCACLSSVHQPASSQPFSIFSLQLITQVLSFKLTYNGKTTVFLESLNCLYFINSSLKIVH